MESVILAFMCVEMREEVRCDHPCYHHLADVLSVSILKRKNHYNFLVSCLVSTVFSSRTVCTEGTNYQPHGGAVWEVVWVRGGPGWGR